MASEVVNGQRFCEAIREHIGATDPFNNEFTIGDQLSDIVVLNIDVFGPGLAFGILCEDDAGLVVSVEYTSIDGVCNS